MLAQQSPKLSVAAKEFIPTFALENNALPPKKKKTKEERAAPRRRRRQRKASSDSFDLDTSDLTQRLNDIEKSSQSSNNSNRRPAYFNPNRTPRNRDTESSSEWSDWINSIMERHRTHPPSLTSLEVEWDISGLLSSSLDFPTEFASEANERRKWCDWAIHAAEVERRRRIHLLREIDEYEARERQARRRWAIDAIEKERHERISSQFINNLTTTKWFNETISTYHEDYELVCPYVRLGCRAVCRRSTIESHMKQCVFALEATHQEVSLTEYDAVCPNSVLGCTHISNREELAKHLVNCEFNGKTRQQELEERQILKQHVILECEEERVRRLADVEDEISPVPGWSPDGSDNRKKASLHKFMERQMSSVVSQLHDDVYMFWQDCCEEHQKRKGFEARFINSLRKKIHRLWPFATVELFGSRATGLPSMSSDMDVVVCFNDQYADLPSITGVIPLLQALTAFLEKEASDVLTINKVLLHTRVPLIKAEAHRSLRTAAGGDWGAVAVDISIDSPAHSGLAASAMVSTVLSAYPGIGPVASVVKHYLKDKGLCDAYSGGLPSYGVILLTLLIFLRRYGTSGTWSPPSPARTPNGPNPGTLSPTSTSIPPSKADISKAMGRIHQQKEYGKRVASRLLGLEDGATPCPVDMKSPMLGVMLVEFMSYYGDHFEKYGFSVRQGGFNFDILAPGVPAHPQADHPMLIEDPVNVMNNVAINTFQAGSVQRAFQDASEQFKLLVVRYSSKGQNHERGGVMSEMLNVTPLGSNDKARPRRRLNPQLVKEMEQKHHRDRQRDVAEGEFKLVLEDLLRHRAPRPQRRMSGGNDMMHRLGRGTPPRRRKRGSSCHSV